LKSEFLQSLKKATFQSLKKELLQKATCPDFEKRTFVKRFPALPLQKDMSEKAAGKGGPRHFSKPWLDPDVLLKVFSEQKSNKVPGLI